MKKKVTSHDPKQKGYFYYVTEPPGKHFDPEFRPGLTPKQMLKLGVFGGRYMEREVWKEFPKEWLKGVQLSESDSKEAELNYFKVNASQPLSVWKKKGWIHPQDPRGWFQWYCRYYMGRRSEDDARQIKRWKAIGRHSAQVKKFCKKGDFSCRPRQRQALLHWAVDSRKL